MLSQANLQNKSAILENIQEAEFRVFSEWGDDGIIQFLIHYLQITQRTFIEFGVANYIESNTRFLLENNNWQGLIIDGSPNNIDFIKAHELFRRHYLVAVSAFIDRDNINSIIVSSGARGDIGLLHIDIDGNDYYVWKAIECVSPILAIIEFNSVFGIKKPWSIPYDPKFQRTECHYSNLYFGASLLSLCDLAQEKGYCFIGCNSAGNNAYFVRKDKVRDLHVKSPEEGYVQSMFRESRDRDGNFDHIAGEDRLRSLYGMNVFNTRTKQCEVVGD